MKYRIWKTTRSVQNEFQKSLDYLVGLMNKVAHNANGNTDKYVADMKNFQQSEAYERYLISTVKRMVTPIARSNFNTWRKAARKATKSKEIYNALINELQTGIGADVQTQIMENATLIRTLPLDTAQKVVEEVKVKTFEGLRASEIAKLISVKTNQHAGASARLIARTEVSKTTTALTKARSENLGLNWYVWRTSLDGDRVRKSHRIMEGVLVNWNDPPSPEELAGEKSVGKYHAGNIWNCRCYPEPLLEPEDVKWPHKVYYQGKIQTMAKQKFLEIF